MNTLAIVVDLHTLERSERVVAQLSALKQKHPELDILWVQQGQSSPSRLGVSEDVTILNWPDNFGYAGAIRRAIDHALAKLNGQKPELYWCLNGDLTLGPDCFERLRDLFETHPKSAAAGPRVMHGDETSTKVWGARGIVDPILGRTAMVDWPVSKAHTPLPLWSYIPGSCIMIRASAYHEVGGLPEVYFLYYEETELCVRLQQKGWELYCDSQAVAYHDVASRADRIPAPHYAYYFVRNNLLFWQRCFGFSKRSQWLRLFVFVFLKEIVLPLRRASSITIAWDRLRWGLRGLRDATRL